MEVTPVGLAVLAAWRSSTPLDPWTNNPLGMPPQVKGTGLVPHTGYAAFPSIADFYTAFAIFTKSNRGKAVKDAIAAEKPYGEIWRAIDVLNWPGGKTETDYPAKVLDMATQAYRDSVDATPHPERKTSGVSHAPQSVHDAMRAQAASIHQATQAFSDSRKAVQYLIRKHASNG
jgi:hypothetical protein